jgi:hypothetical protein
MRRMTLIAAAVIALLALAAPAYAGYRVLSDNFDRASGTGIAVLQLEPQLFAEVRYRDMDRTFSYTDADHRLHVRYFRRGDAVTLPTIGPVGQTIHPAGH